ncbi:MAG: DUF1080 domain-containing protein [Akkermansiaceae bacterium]|nr:DUF1080 domain-containing protein [Akkermansiaceae bacterium]
MKSKNTIPRKKTWGPFAQGLQIPLGLLEEKDGSILAMQWSGLTRLRDTDGDGLADEYQNVCNDFGITGNYHEFAYGPARDKNGNLYVVLNVASNNGPISKEIRGPFTEIGLDRELMVRLKEPEIKKKYASEAGRMYSRAAYRGCVLKITPGGKCTPFAYGFRSPGDLSLWYSGNKGAKWTLENGVAARGKEKAGSLVSKKSYKNFDLKFEWKISEGGNSGVIYRGGLEYQLLDDERHIRGKTPNSSAAALYDLVAPGEEKTVHPAGEWNSGRIITDGNHVEHWLNGKKVLETELDSDDWNTRFQASKYKDRPDYGTKASNIQFQDHGAEVWLRNVLIRELP